MKTGSSIRKWNDYSLCSFWGDPTEYPSDLAESRASWIIPRWARGCSITMLVPFFFANKCNCLCVTVGIMEASSPTAGLGIQPTSFSPSLWITATTAAIPLHFLLWLPLGFSWGQCGEDISKEALSGIVFTCRYSHKAWKYHHLLL